MGAKRKNILQRIGACVLSAALVTGMYTPIAADSNDTEAAEEKVVLTEITVPDGDFEEGNADAWTQENDDGVSVKVFQNQWMTNNMSYIYECGTTATGTAAIRQTIQNLETGIYKAAVDVGGANAAVLSAGSTSVDIPSTEWNSWNTYSTDFFEVKDGETEISVSTDMKNSYLNLDNIKLYRLNLDNVTAVQTMDLNVGENFTAPEKYDVMSSDGKKMQLDVKWDTNDLKAVDMSKEGTYIVNGKVSVSVDQGSDATKIITKDVKLQVNVESVFEKSVADFTLPYTEVYGNITLPEKTEEGVSITWTTDRPDIVDVNSYENKDYDKTPAGKVKRPAEDTKVTMTALFTEGEKTETKEFTFTVKKAPEPVGKLTSYMFAHFTGVEKNPTDEQIYFATSEDSVNWTDLSEDGNPILTSTVGEEGVRDPYILRSAEGDKFFLLATDLCIVKRAGGWTGTLDSASTNMVVWESDDLVHWSEPRLVDIAGKIKGAGCMWAPEAFYDEKTGEYVVFWATHSDESNKLGDAQNIYYAKTRDFYTFTDPVLWIDNEIAILDTTMIEADGMYYRASAADANIRIDKSTSICGEWETVGTLQGIFNNSMYSGKYLEGPELFLYCEDEWLKDEDGNPVQTWGLMCDQFKEGKGYLPFKTTDLSSTSTDDWSVSYDVNYGNLKKRHGSILTITTEEYERLMDAYVNGGTKPGDGTKPDDGIKPGDGNSGNETGKNENKDDSSTNSGNKNTDNSSQNVDSSQKNNSPVQPEKTTVNEQKTKVSKPAKVKNVKVKNSGRKAMKVTFKKVSGAAGYEVRYAVKANMKGAKKVTSKKNAVTIKKLKKGRTYYVQVRAYKVDSTGKKIYSKSYSTKVKIKIKK